MPDIERYVEALEALPEKYPDANVGQVFGEVVKWYVGDLSFEEGLKLLRDAPAPLVADLLHILKSAADDSLGGGGASRAAKLPPMPGPRAAAAALKPPTG